MKKLIEIAIGVLTLVLMLIMKFGLGAIYFYSVYEAYSANGARGLFVAIPFLGQLLWAGVKLSSSGLFNTYFYLIYITFGSAALLALLTVLFPKDD